MADVQSELYTLIVLTQAAFGLKATDNTGNTIFSDLQNVFNSDANLPRLKLYVIENEFARVLSRVSEALRSAAATNAPNRDAVLEIARAAANSFDFSRVMFEQSLAKPPLTGKEIKAYPITGPPKRNAPSGRLSPNPNPPKKNNNNNNNNGGKGQQGQGGHGAATKAPCHNLKAFELSLPGSTFCSGGSSCPHYDHTPLPAPGVMSKNEKDTLIKRIKKSKTKWSKAVADALATY